MLTLHMLVDALQASSFLTTTSHSKVWLLAYCGPHKSSLMLEFSGGCRARRLLVSVRAACASAGCSSHCSACTRQPALPFVVSLFARRAPHARTLSVWLTLSCCRVSLASLFVRARECLGQRLLGAVDFGFLFVCLAGIGFVTATRQPGQQHPLTAAMC